MDIFFFFFFISSLLVLSNSHQLAVPTGCNDPIMFVFGDSNSDTGGNDAAFGFGIFTQYPSGNIFPFQPSGRACNGRLVIDFLCENVNTTYLQPFLNSLEPNFGNGANFAVSGSSAVLNAYKMLTYNPYSLGTQISQFGRFRNRSLDLESKGSEQKLVGEAGFKRALYIIDIGQNDLSNAYGHGSYEAVIAIIPNITLEIKKAVQSIYDMGGRRFWVHSTGPLGNDLSEGVQTFNKHLSALCEELRNEKKDATIVYVDVYAIKYDLFANAKRYGFDYPLIACSNGGKICEDQSKHILWDGIHYTEAANAIVASKIASANYSTPPLPFNFFCDGSVN